MKSTRTPLGRPRAFDCQQALDRALHVFWEKGYEGASLTDLTRAMGINRPSLYAAFGNKEALFRKVLDRYLAASAPVMREALREPTARAVVARFLHAVADSVADPKNPRGCLIVKSAFSCGDDSNALRDELIAQRAAGFAALRERFKKARAEGDLPSEADPAALARYVSVLSYGMAVEAVNGSGRASRADLRRLVDVVLASWPS
jgi:AcrR family transcriptional regulator